MTNKKKWIEDAIKDGWEDVSHPFTLFKLKKDDFTFYSLHGDDGFCYGPDGLYVEIPEEYSYEELLKNLHKCSLCGNKGKTYQIGFAERVCLPCRENYFKEELDENS